MANLSLYNLTADILESKIFYYLSGPDLIQLSQVNRKMRNRMFAIQPLTFLGIHPNQLWPELSINFKDEYKIKNIPEPQNAISLEDADELLECLSRVKWRFPKIIVNSTSFPRIYRYLPFCQNITLHVLDDVCFEELSFVLQFNLITELYFEPVPGITEIDVHFLVCNFERMSKLKKLTVRSPFDLEIAWIFSEYLPKSRIEILDLDDSALDYEHLSLICPALEKSRITILSLQRNPLHTEGIEILSCSLRKTLIKELILDGVEMDSESMYTLSIGLMYTKIQKLSLNDIKLDDEDINYIFNVLPQTNIRELLFHDKFGPQSTETLIKNLRHSKIEKAVFQISPDFLEEFLHAASSSLLVDFHLVTRGDLACSIIAQNQQYFKFSRFCLSTCKITIPAFGAFVSILPQSLVETLELNADIGDAGLEILASYLPFTRITKLLVNQCGFGDSGVKCIAHCLQYSKLRHLEMSSFSTTDDGLIYLLERMSTNLRYLNVTLAKIDNRDLVRAFVLKYPHMTIKY
ncbi:hypothetical protein HK103_003173 [Boothiomyces macroporosus]|uniref:F-box domain-containing protein n=1 Tax=Boothiomyces macroporosus TaxID=261099 RepID=A0AAD5U8W4_9FUNG|nr:hypothetical protein HK103_003173 [Boothiomyces macroporosus]